MGIALRQAYHTYPATSQAAVSVVAGDLIIVAYAYGATVQTITCTDTASGGSNTYQQAGSGSNAQPSAGNVLYAIAKATETVTISCTSQTDAGIAVHVVSGALAILGSVLDQVNNSTDGALSTSHTSATITNLNANDYIFVLWADETSSNTTSENGTGFTKETEDGGHYSATYDQVVSSTGSYQDSITSTSSAKLYNVIASFKAILGPAINTQPANQSVYVGQTATFTVSATTSGGSLSYQWQQYISGSWTNVGTNSSSYTTGAAGFADNGDKFQVLVTDSNGTTTSATAILTVIGAASIAWLQ